MSKSKSHSGGRTPVRTPVRTGPPNTKVISPSAVARIGIAQGNHATEGGTVRPPSDPLVKGVAPQVPMGNAVALNVGSGGPGAGRTVHSSGGQGQHGPAVQGTTPQPRDILIEFGPESKP